MTTTTTTTPVTATPVAPEANGQHKPGKAPGKPGKATKTAKPGKEATKGRKPAKGTPEASKGKAKTKPAKPTAKPQEYTPTAAGRKAEASARRGASGAFRGTVYGYSVASVMRSMGYAGATWQECHAAMHSMGVPVSEGCAKCQAADGAREAAGGTTHYGKPAPLAKGEVKALLELGRKHAGGKGQ